MQIIISGSLAVDQIMSFDGLFEKIINPDNLSKISISQLASGLHKTRGGTAGNIAYSLSLFQEKPVLLASIGKDNTSYINDLKELGVDTSFVHVSKEPTATFSVLTDSNNCQIGGFYPGAMSDASSLSFSPFKNKDAFAVISPHDPTQMKKQVSECKKYNIPMMYDVGQQVIYLPKEDLTEGIEAASIVIVNEYEMNVLQEKTEMSLEEIIAHLNVCIVTKGEAGSELYSAKTKSWTTVPAYKVNAIDPTGAGDAYRAGFLYGYTQGWDAVQCAQYGSIAGSFAVEKKGTQNHKFTSKMIEKRLTIIKAL